MKNEVWGYARVSTKEQNLARQIEQLKEFGISERNIKCDKISGKTFNRMEYNALVGTETTAPTLREGDLLVIVSLDRLGRNYTEIKEQWNYIINVIGADIVVLDMPLLDTRQSGDNLDKRFIADLVLQILSYVAQKELENTRRRQKQGMLWSSYFVTLVAKKIVLINLCCRPCFIWGSITIITVWTNMIIINVCKFFYLLIECFLCCKFIQICAFILQGIEVTLHRCIVVRISCVAHALCHIYRFAEFGKCFGRIL